MELLKENPAEIINVWGASH